MVNILELQVTYLCEQIEHYQCDLIARSLKSDGIIDGNDLKNIKHDPASSKTNTLIACLVKCKQHNRAFRSFLNALPEGLKHVKEFLECGLNPTSDKEKIYSHIVEICLPTLSQTISGDELVYIMITDPHIRQYIKSLSTPIMRNTEFIQEVLKIPNGIFELLDHLKTGLYGDMSHVISLIEGKDNQDDCDPKKSSCMNESLTLQVEESGECNGLKSSSLNQAFVDDTDGMSLHDQVDQSDSCDDSSDDDVLSDEGNLSLRKYQEELARPALNGKSCVIVAPTGSGKTRVAIRICVEHLKQHPSGKVVFFVPKQPLVEQQYDSFKKYMPEDVVINHICGGTPAKSPNVEIIKDSSCLILTHQILLTILEERKMSIGDFSLLIFDECHNTRKKHPYNDIMKVYGKEKSLNPATKLPQLENYKPNVQIVGLTATPGSDRAVDEKEACNNVLQLLANIHVTHPPVEVWEHTQELEEFTAKGDFEMVELAQAVASDFFKKITVIMKKIESQIRTKIKQNENVVGKLEFSVKDTLGCPQYRTDIDKFKRDISQQVINDEVLHQLKIYANHLLMYNEALGINQHIHEVSAVEYIEQNLFRECGNSTVNTTEETLQKLYNKSELTKMAKTDPSPPLRKLVDILREHFAKSPDSRCIVFALTRDIARLLVECLNETAELSHFQLNASFLTGSGAKNSDGGLTKTKQDERLRDFRKGKSKVMVATSIADEGIDVKDCNLVLVYNHSSNEIARIQRQGRGRALDSKMYILAYKEFIEKEKNNKRRAELTRKALAKLSEMSPQVLAEKVKKLITDSQPTPKAKAPLQLDKCGIVQEIWDFHCRECNFLVTTSEHFRMAKQHHANVDPELSTKTSLDRSGIKSIAINNTPIICGNPKGCRSQLGHEMKIHGDYIPVLKVEKFVLENRNGDKKTPNKWNAVPFTVDKQFVSSTNVNISTDSSDDFEFEFEF